MSHSICARGYPSHRRRDVGLCRCRFGHANGLDPARVQAYAAVRDRIVALVVSKR